MTLVTWGTNTTRVIGSTGVSSTAPAPAPASTGFNFLSNTSATPAPSSGGFFGSTAPSPGGIFGSSTTAPTTSTFGQAPSTGFFGSSPAPSGGLFGSSTPAPSGGLFGSSTPSAFGSTPQQQQQQQQIPAQAAMQAHMDASARQEQHRIGTAFTSIRSAYEGTAPASDKKSAPYVSIFYNPASPQMRQEQLIRGIGLDGKPIPIAPPRPPQIAEKEWMTAVVRNPDSSNLMPIPAVGAKALLARSTGQQEQVNTYLKHLDVIQETQDSLRQHHQKTCDHLYHLMAAHKKLRERLLTAVQKVELLRCLNHPLQTDEGKAINRLKELSHYLERLRLAISQSHDELERHLAQPRSLLRVTNVPNDEEQLKNVLLQHRQMLEQLTSTMRQDMGDLRLIQGRVQEKVPRLR